QGPHLPHRGRPRPRGDRGRHPGPRTVPRGAGAGGRQGCGRRGRRGAARPAAPGRGGHAGDRADRRPHHRVDRGGTRDRLARVRLHEGGRCPHGGGQGRRAGGAGRAPRARGVRPRAGGRHGAPLREPALPAQAGGAARDPGGVMAEKATIEKILPEKATGPNGHGPREAPKDAAAARRRLPRKARGEPGRWVREAKGILALALAGFGFVALYAYDPTLHPLDQVSPVGPVGGWLGWGSFQAFGYAGYLFPLLLTLYGVSAFVRPRMAHGWQAAVGLAILLVSATGILARASDTLTEFRLHKGGVVGWAVSESLRLSIGTVGTWIILLALIPLGVLFVTRIPYSVLSRGLRARFGRLRRAEAPARKGRGGAGASAAASAAAAPLPAALAPLEPAAAPKLVVKEPPKAKSGLSEK